MIMALFVSSLERSRTLLKTLPHDAHTVQLHTFVLSPHRFHLIHLILQMLFQPQWQNLSRSLIVLAREGGKAEWQDQ